MYITIHRPDPICTILGLKRGDDRPRETLVIYIYIYIYIVFCEQYTSRGVYLRRCSIIDTPWPHKASSSSIQRYTPSNINIKFLDGYSIITELERDQLGYMPPVVCTGIGLI